MFFKQLKIDTGFVVIPFEKSDRAQFNEVLISLLIARQHSEVIKGIFLPGTPMQHIIDFIHAHVRARVADAPASARVEL